MREFEFAHKGIDCLGTGRRKFIDLVERQTARGKEPASRRLMHKSTRRQLTHSLHGRVGKPAAAGKAGYCVRSI